MGLSQSDFSLCHGNAKVKDIKNADENALQSESYMELATAMAELFEMLDDHSNKTVSPAKVTCQVWKGMGTQEDCHG